MTIANSTKLELVKCGTEYFNYSNKAEILSKGINNYLCIKNKTWMSTGGVFTTNIYQYLVVTMVPCLNNTNSDITCAQKETQDAYLRGVRI